jgi:tetrahydromethanopterin S-methyltransferase subunit A
MRLVDLDRAKNSANVNDLIKEFLEKEKNEKENEAIVIEGEIAEAEYQYQRIVKIKPLITHYSTTERYVKYSCPICKTVGNSHQLTRGATNCSLCNVNLTWEGIE